jgi:UDP-2,4-diacetamido-2,4,6-trideoxy-beta-L-altropyranose hydrolase
LGDIFILTEGGGLSGMGHISRCMSLCQALEMQGRSPVMIVKGDDSVSKVLSGITYLLFDWIRENDRVLQLIQGADIVLIDSYVCPEHVYELLSGSAKLDVYIDDEMRINYPPGIIINGVLCAEKMGYKKKDDRDYLLGKEYAFLRKEFWEVPEKNIRTSIESIMISCGGNDTNRLSYRVLRSLTEAYPLIKKKIIISDPNMPDIAYLREHAVVLHNLDATDMLTLMTGSDIAVTASGQTTYELCRVGTPFIALTTAQNQFFSIGCFRKEGLVMEAIDAADEQLGVKITEQVQALQKYERRLALHKRMRQMIDGRGSENVAKRLLQHLHAN